MQPGEQFGHYEILSAIGKGGMGEVWKAKDTKLGREVAIKALPPEFAHDADRLSRFEREAKLLASLNHPNIAVIHGLEEHEGTQFLVLELIGGQTLGEFLEGGALPVESALKIAVQIAEALEAAHAKGVVHRDLKPGNIKVVEDGTVKVLDFGLAKSVAGDSAAERSGSMGKTGGLTQEGTIQGTPAYMSPEQVRGENVNAQADIWAFGCVLFELLTGRWTFGGDTVSDILAAVLVKEPDWDHLSPRLHPRIRLLLERCLDKELRDRYHSIADVRIEIQKALADPDGLAVDPLVVTPPAQSRKRMTLTWIAVILLAAMTGVGGWTLRPADSAPVVRFRYLLPAGQAFRVPTRPMIAMSHDGSMFVYNADDGVYARRTDELEATLIPGTESILSSPILSPDGRWLAYWSSADQQLKKIPVVGGAAVRLAEVPSSPFGISWDASDMIVYGQPTGLWSVSSEGGEPEPLNSAGQYPQMLPDGDAVLFSDANGQVLVQSLDSAEPEVLFPGTRPRYVATGHIAYELDGKLYARSFDHTTRTTTDDASIEVVRDVMPLQYDVSDSGSLVYAPGTGVSIQTVALITVGRDGDIEPLVSDRRAYLNPRVSPEGDRVAVEITDIVGSETTTQIYIVDLETGRHTQLTFEGSLNQFPCWTPDGQSVVFASNRDGTFDIYQKSADGFGGADLVYASDHSLWPTHISLDGVLAFVKFTDSESQSDIWTLNLDQEGSESEFLATTATEGSATFSPDGRWLAYASDESGQPVVYARPYPRTAGSVVRVSDGPGGGPMWSLDGGELYYADLRTFGITAVPTVTTDSRLVRGNAEGLYEFSHVSAFISPFGASFTAYGVAPDRRLLFVTLDDQADSGEPMQPEINVVLNWTQELLERVQAD